MTGNARLSEFKSRKVGVRIPDNSEGRRDTVLQKWSQKITSFKKRSIGERGRKSRINDGVGQENIKCGSVQFEKFNKISSRYNLSEFASRKP
ncbi:hypothetical protein L3Y34_003433 [Caenorhabditis briggsae]|uniref:Uncharacterized protein n=1 Tax=Caenorhabditis briggsae TaxID=6238 RepID=A0AAE9D5T3_CAEBR|nr:hypothetical protein L3Y34_003433 [Caenorhabditis briggsae]